MKKEFDLGFFMTICCALWILYGLCCIIVCGSWWVILVNIGCIIIQLLCTIYNAKQSKFQFSDFFTKIKESDFFIKIKEVLKK